MSKQVASFDRSDRGPSPIELFVSSRQVDSTMSFLGRGRGSDRNRESIVAEESLSRGGDTSGLPEPNSFYFSTSPVSRFSRIAFLGEPSN